MTEIILKEENIAPKIYHIRGEKVMLDEDLAELYGVETKVLNQALKRNSTRFPEDFVFQLTDNEMINLRSQFVTSNKSNYGGRRYLPYVFTEHGAVMLASVLNSPTAVNASIFVVRAFVKIRHFMLDNLELSQKIADLEKETKAALKEHSEQIQMVFEAIQNLIEEKNEAREPIGFKVS
jgi:ORF6N domain